MKRRVTRMDVAKAAGVAPCTVSMILNGTVKVAEDTRRRVLDAVAKLRYRPNASARLLGRLQTGVAGVQRTGNIGVILSSRQEEGLQNPYFSGIIAGILSETQVRRLRFMAGVVPEPYAKVIDMPPIIAEELVDGIVIVGEVARGFIDELDALRLPEVYAESYSGGCSRRPVTTVTVDEFRGGYLAGRFLADHGHRDIALVSGPADYPATPERRAGFIAALEERGMRFDPSREIAGEFSSDVSRAAIRPMLSGPRRPTAVFAMNDLSAMGVYDAARDLGLKVPDDLSVVGFDDIAVAAQLDPGLTTVHAPRAELGAKALALLCAMIDGTESSALRVAVAPRIVTRGSVRTLA